MPSKSLRTQKSREQPISQPSPLYLIVDTTLPSHIINDHSLFMTYTPRCKVHCTAFGHDIIIEGTRDAHIRVFAAGQYICFRMRHHDIEWASGHDHSLNS